MYREKSSSLESPIFTELTYEFSNFRATGARKYPPELRQMAVSALAKGFKQSAVAKAAGVSSSLLSHWKNGRRKPKLLNIVDKHLPCSKPRQMGKASSRLQGFNQTFVVRLISGVEIELPETMWGRELLESLMALRICLQ